MSNALNQNPMIIDTAAREISGADVKISAIVVNASNATWAVLLQDKNKKTVFSANNVAGPVHFAPAAPFPVSGLYMETLTNASIAVYLAH